MDMDVPIICINSKNIDKLNTLGLYDEDKAIIREAVESGAYVTVPERNIRIDSWTGTGYIIQNEATGDLTFKISGALNGGATPNKATQDALKKFALICGSVAFVDTVSALYSSVMMMSNAVMSLMFASSTLGVVGSVAIIGASIALMNAALKSYQAAIRNCFLALEGNPEAAMELLIDTELTLIVNVLGELGGITASAIKNRIAKNYIKSSLPEELVPEIYKAFEGSEESVAKFMKTAKNAGIDTDCLTKLLRDSGCIDKYPKKVLKQLGKLEKEAQWAIIDGIEKCSKDLPDILKKLDKDGLEKFFKAVSKDADEVFEKLAKISDVEKAVQFIAKYGDDAEHIIKVYSEDGLSALKCGITPNQILIIESHGITPKDYFGNRKIISPEKAQKIIDEYIIIHEKFTLEEITTLKNNVVAMENTFKKAEGMTNKELGPAICGVYNKKTGEFFYSLNAVENVVPSDGVKLIDDRIADMPEEIYDSYKDMTIGKGTHAEVYAVSKALSKAGTNPDDLLIYVNRTTSITKEAKYNPFVTCPHCAYILDGLNIVSNVEI